MQHKAFLSGTENIPEKCKFENGLFPEKSLEKAGLGFLKDTIFDLWLKLIFLIQLKNINGTTFNQP